MPVIVYCENRHTPQLLGFANGYASPHHSSARSRGKSLTVRMEQSGEEPNLWRLVRIFVAESELQLKRSCVIRATGNNPQVMLQVSGEPVKDNL